MKNICKKAMVALLTLTATMFTACTIDAYDKGEGEYSLMTAEMVDATVDSKKYVGDVETDQGEHLILAKPVTMKWMEKGDTTYRALLYYKQQTDGKAEVVSMNKVGVLKPRQLKTKGEQTDTIMKMDPLYMESIWLSKNRKYVNLRLRLLTGATDDEKAVQTLGAVNDTANSTGNHQRLILYHDQGGQPEYYSSTVFVSIPLADIHADSLTIAANTYDGLVSKTISW